LQLPTDGFWQWSTQEVSVSYVVFFDLETQRTFDEVGGRANIAQLGLAAAVTYNTRDQSFHYYLETMAAELVRELEGADLVVGFNLLSFDYPVLQPYTEIRLRDLPTLDMLDYLYRRLGFRLGLDALARATLGVAKSADGLQAVYWFREGRLDKVLAYCQQDVQITRDLFEFGRQRRHVLYRDQHGQLQRVSVSW